MQLKANDYATEMAVPGELSLCVFAKQDDMFKDTNEIGEFYFFKTAMLLVDTHTFEVSKHDKCLTSLRIPREQAGRRLRLFRSGWLLRPGGRAAALRRPQRLPRVPDGWRGKAPRVLRIRVGRAHDRAGGAARRARGVRLRQAGRRRGRGVRAKPRRGVGRGLRRVGA